MKLLGIDYGKKRIGIALSDDRGLMAFPQDVYKNDEKFFQLLLKIISEHNVEVIVIGESKNRAGEHNEIQAAVTELVTDLTLELGIPVHLEPEQYTTQEAIRFQGRTEKTDAAAAAIILNSFISRQK